MSKAAELAIADAGLTRAEIDGVLLAAIPTVAPHINAGDRVRRAFWGSFQLTRMPCRSAAPPGLAMTMLAHHLVDAGVCQACAGGLRREPG